MAATNLEQAAASIVRRLPEGFGAGEPVGFDPMTILILVLPMLLRCFNQASAGDDPNTITQQLKTANERNPEQLARRTARRIRGDADHPMTKSASFFLAHATIEHALETSEETAMACCAEADV